MGVDDAPEDAPQDPIFMAYEGFSTIVGWQQDCGSFVLIPGPPPE